MELIGGRVDASTAVFLAIGLTPVIVGVGLVLGGVALRRSSRRARARQVPVVAFVVEHTFGVRPAFVTFDYPTSAGWVRATAVVHAPLGSTRPGDRLTVWVDPADPHQVSLAASSAAGVGGVLMVAAGAVFALIGLVLLLGVVLGSA